jgi:lycopene beta-cyclase
MDHYQYDIAIIGMGCAGSHILLEMMDQPELRDKKILVLDDFNAESLDKTWSFWEKGIGKWDSLLSFMWQKGKFQTTKVNLDFSLNPYRYKKLESKDFIAFAKANVLQQSNITLVESNVESIIESNVATLKTATQTFKAKLVLDSRIPKEFFTDKKATTLKQHFLGWQIRTDQDIFDPERFVMMDYRLRDPGTTSFMYILPYSKTEALVEFTYFSADLVKDHVYETYLKQFIREYLDTKKYEITATEQGVIPMTSYRFDRHHTTLVHKIGTAGGWVKASTGYSFKLGEKRAKILVENYMAGKPLDEGMQKKRFQFYDEIMLDVLSEHNDKGHLLFENLYTNNPIGRIFAFLDEETRFSQEVKIMLPLTSMPFIKGFFKQLF